MASIFLGVSLKMYLDHRATIAWSRRVAALVASEPVVSDRRVVLAILPGFVSLNAVARILESTGVEIGGQDLSWAVDGPYTGEVSGRDLAEIGCRYVVVGHAERRRLFAEDDAVVAAKMAAAVRSGLTPILCVGEEQFGDQQTAIRACRDQLLTGMSRLAGLRPKGAGETVARPGAGVSADPDVSGAPKLIVAYEPMWAIGADQPASSQHVQAVCQALRSELDRDHRSAAGQVVYGGSAGPGTLTQLWPAVDGLFLGRFAHDPDALAAVIGEAAALV